MGNVGKNPLSGLQGGETARSLLGFFGERDHRWSEPCAETRESRFAFAAISAKCEDTEMDLERAVQLRQFLRMAGDESDAEFAQLVTEPMSQRGWKAAS